MSDDSGQDGRDDTSHFEKEVNSHLTPHPILLTRHGESMENVRGDTGELYAKKLANFVEKCLKNERAASVIRLAIAFNCSTVVPVFFSEFLTRWRVVQVQHLPIFCKFLSCSADCKSFSDCNATGDIISTTERLKQELETTMQRLEIAL